MKTTLPERSLGIKPLLDQAIPEILIAGKNTRQVINKNVDNLVENMAQVSFSKVQEVLLIFWAVEKLGVKLNFLYAAYGYLCSCYFSI